MNKLFKYVYAGLIGLMAVGTGACSDDDDNYSPGEQPEGAQVYFPTSNPASLTLSSTETSFDISIARIVTDAALSVPLTVTGNEDGLYTIPSTASFAAGQAQASVTITYDPDAVGFDNYTSLTFTIGSDTTPYGLSAYTVTVGIPAPWTSLGKGTFSDTWMFEDSYSVEIQQNDINPNIFRLVDPYSEGLEKEGYVDYGYVNAGPSEYVEFRILQPGEELNGSTVSRSDLVYYADFNTGYYHTTYSDEVVCVHPARFTSLAGEENWTHNCVKSLQENGLPAIVQFAPYYYMFSVGGWNYTQNDGVITIVFPGVVMLDTSVEVVYTGLFTSIADGTVSAVADITLGEDVAEAKVALVAGNDASAAADGIIDGSIASTSITANGEVKLTFPEGAEAGKYTIVVVTYAEGEAQEAASATFTYTPATSETWTAVATGTYQYAWFWTGDDPGLTLYQSDEDPTRYKIEHWGADVDFLFTYDENTGEVMVAEQETGYVHSTYGIICVDDVVNYFEGTDYGYSYYEDGVFHFNVIYYVSDGYFGYGEETFTLDSSSASAAAKVSRKAGPADKSLSPRQTKRNQPRHKGFPQAATLF